MKFVELGLNPELQSSLEKIGFSECTPIQASAIPLVLQGKDVGGLAQTGTGKTGAFLVPLIQRILAGKSGVGQFGFPDWKPKQFVLVLVPTRELADQVEKIAQTLLMGTDLQSVAVYGGTSYDKQVPAFRKGAELVVATPGRLMDLFKEHVADLSLVRAVVFDEADRLFDMGFKDDMKFILRRVPKDRQFLVFSATLNFEVTNMAYEFGAHPIDINVSRDQAKAENVEDSIFHVGQEDKPKYLLSLLKKYQPKQAIIFSNFKHQVERLSLFLTRNECPAVGISSLLTQAQRNRVMHQFKSSSERSVLVATDLAARGLDILGVDLVINYDLPDDPENYVHRIGRTGRAGQKGTALSLVSDRDVDALGRVEEYLGHKLSSHWLDDVDLVEPSAKMPTEYDLERAARTPARVGRPPRGTRGRERGSAGGRESNEHKGGNRPLKKEAHRDRRSGRHRDRGRDQGHQTESRNQNAERPNIASTGRSAHHRHDRHAPGRRGSVHPSNRSRTSGDRGRSVQSSSRTHVRSAKVVTHETLSRRVSRFFKSLFSSSK